MSNDIKEYKVPHEFLETSKGSLKRLRSYLVSIEFPLASNEELGVPDEVIRMREGFHLKSIRQHGDHNIYYVEEITVDIS